MKFKKGDKVIILTGKDQGKKGKISNVYPEKGRVVVEGLNLLIKNVRPKKSGEHGQRVQFSRAIDSSNVALICPKCSKKIRIGYQMLNDSKKVRFCKKCKSTID